MVVTVISAHPDDEIIGAGGTLFKHKLNGDEIHWIIITNIFKSQGFSESKIKQRQAEIKKISKLLGVTKVHLLNFPTMTLSSSCLLKMVPIISKIFNNIMPNTVYVMNRSDAHSDHRVTFDAVMACTKSFRYPFIKKVLMYECLSETEFAPALHEKIFIPNYFVNISDFLEEKINAMNVYKSELGDHPFPRSILNIKALATYRGASVGVLYAEAFQLLKFID